MDPRDRELASALRHVIGQPRSAATETNASQLTTYLQAYLRVHLRRRRFGFDRPITEIAAEVAHLEVGTLLTDGDATPMIASFGRFLTPRGSPAPSPAEIGGFPDEDLVAAAKQMLRLRGQQGAIRAWKEEHSQEAHLLRALKMSIRRTPGLRIRRDASGQCITSQRSVLRLPPLGVAELTAILRPAHPPFRAPEVVSALVPCLVPADSHGGYCYLMDLVRAIHFMRVEVLTSEAIEASASFPTPGGAIGRDGVPFPLRMQRTLDQLARWADECLAADEAKRLRLRPTAGPRHDGDRRRAIAQIAIDRLLSPVGLGRDEWTELTLEELIALVVPSASADGVVARHLIHEVDYLIRRLRLRLRRAGRGLW